MADPVWFFSALAQAMSAIVGFVITIAAVIYQLDQNSRRERTENLRERLRHLENEYQPPINSIMEMLKQPYDDRMPTDFPPNSELSTTTIDELISEIERSYPIRDKIWLYCNYISYLLDRISEENESSEIYLLDIEEIEELVRATETVSELIYGGEKTLQSRIEQESDQDSVSVSEDLFKNENNEYINLDDWFTQHFDEYNQEQSLNGRNLLSIYNFFDEFNRDTQVILAESEHTTLSQDKYMKNLRWPMLLLLLFGVITPLGAIIELQTNFQTKFLTVLSFQVILLGVLTTVLGAIIYILWSNI